MPSAVARLVELSEAGERELDVTNFAQRTATDNALVGQHFGDGRLGSRQFGDRRRLRGGGQCGDDSARRLELVGMFAHARQGVVGPGRGQLLEVHVAVDTRQQPLGAELGEALVDHASGLAEFRITRIAERQHRVLQLRQLRRPLGAEEFIDAAGFVRRIAVAMRADDNVQQLFLGDFARLVVAGLHHACLHARGLHGRQQLLGNLAAVAGVRGRNDGERRRGLRGWRQRGWCRTPERCAKHMALDGGDTARRGGRDAREVTTQPQQLFAIEAGGELREQTPALVRNRKLALQDDGTVAHRPGSAWCRKPLFSR